MPAYLTETKVFITAQLVSFAVSQTGYRYRVFFLDGQFPRAMTMGKHFSAALLTLTNTVFIL